jgi:hypothetical protein
MLIEQDGMEKQDQLSNVLTLTDS